MCSEEPQDTYSSAFERSIVKIGLEQRPIKEIENETRIARPSFGGRFSHSTQKSARFFAPGSHSIRKGSRGEETPLGFERVSIFSDEACILGGWGPTQIEDRFSTRRF